MLNSSDVASTTTYITGKYSIKVDYRKNKNTKKIQYCSVTVGYAESTDIIFTFNKDYPVCKYTILLLNNTNYMVTSVDCNTISFIDLDSGTCVTYGDPLHIGERRGWLPVTFAWNKKAQVLTMDVMEWAKDVHKWKVLVYDVDFVKFDTSTIEKV